MTFRPSGALCRNSSGPKAADFKREPVDDFYVVGEEIGNGKFAIVRKCQHKMSDAEYAAKFIRKRRTKSSRRGSPWENIEREVDILREAQHDNIVKLYEVYESSLDVVLILEFVSGGEFFHYLVERERVCEAEAVIFQKQILDGIEFLHSRSIIHLDLKPENLVLNGNSHLKIIDFGLSRKLEKNSECRDITGTPEFVAPEVINFDPLSTATDMWSVGVITYIMLSGCSPFLGDNKQETLGNVSLCKYDFDEDSFSNASDLAKDFIQKLLIKEPQYRASATQCLSHPWIKPLNENHILCRRHSVLNVENLKSFIARKRWKQSFHAVCLLNHLSRHAGVRSESKAKSDISSKSEHSSAEDLVSKTESQDSGDEITSSADKE